MKRCRNVNIRGRPVSRKAPVFVLAFALVFALVVAVYADYRPGQDLGAELEILPDIAKPSIGFKSVTSSSYSDYKQTQGSFTASVNEYFTDRQREIFPIESDSRDLTDVIMKSILPDDPELRIQAEAKAGNTGRRKQEDMPDGRWYSGIPVLDDYSAVEYEGIGDDEIKWLVNNQILSRDIPSFEASGDSLSYGELSPMFYTNKSDSSFTKSRFLMALHKAVYGVIESRPIVYQITPYRKAQAVIYTWQEEQWEFVPPTTDMDAYWQMYLPDAWLSSYGFIGDTEVAWSEDEIRLEMAMASGQPNGYSFTRGEYYLMNPGTGEYKVSRYPDSDRIFYVTPNVMELYLKSLLDKGIIDDRNLRLEFQTGEGSTNVLSPGIISEFNVLSLYGKEDSVKNKQYPIWAPELGPWEPSGVIKSHSLFVPSLVGDSDEGNVLGSRYYVDGNGVVCTDTGWIQEFFRDENLTVIEALRFIETIVRQEETDMTDTEAAIVSYKYGSSYLYGFTGNDLRTITYLTAKGILNFENSLEYEMMYYGLTQEFALTLLYRVANPSARADFSKIQLTDVDNFWMEKGYSEIAMHVRVAKESELHKLKDESGELWLNPVPDAPTIDVKYLEDTADTQRPSLLTSSLEIISPYAEPTVLTDYLSKFLVVKEFDDIRKYTWRGRDLIAELVDFGIITISDETDAESFAESLPGGSWSAPDDAVLGNPNGRNGSISVTWDTSNKRYIAEFEVWATDEWNAIAKVDSNLRCKLDAIFGDTRVGAVTRVTKDKDKEILLVPQSSFSTLDAELVAIEDKILFNRKTGSKAVILEERGLALVGTEIIHCEDIMVRVVNGEVYYNFDIIRPLLSNTYASDIDKKNIYTCDVIGDDIALPVKSSLGATVSKAWVSEFTYNRPVINADGSVGPDTVDKTAKFVKLNSLDVGDNILVRYYKEKIDNHDVDFVLLVQWDLILPDNEANLVEFENLVPDNSSLKIGDISSFYYTRPDNKELADWWDSNIEISNAIANYMYGDKQKEYIKSGYLVPSIRIIYGVDDAVIDDNGRTASLVRGKVAEIFKDIGSRLDREWVLKFIGDYNNFNKIWSDGTIPIADSTTSIKDGSTGIHYPPKTLTSGWFPAWIHICFNNFGGDSVYPADAANERMWRSLAVNRKIYFNEATKAIGGSFRVFADTTAKTEESSVDYILTKSGDLYRELKMVSGLYLAQEHTVVPVTGSVVLTDVLISNSRSSTLQYTLSRLGSSVVFKGEKYYFNRLDGQYMEFLAETAVVGTYDNRGNTLFFAEGYENSMDAYTYSENVLMNKFKVDGVLMSGVQYNLVTTLLPILYYKDYPEEDSIFIIYDMVNGSPQSYTKKYDKDVGQLVSVAPNEGNNILYNAPVRLNLANWYIKSDTNELAYRTTSSVFLVDNIFSAGLSRSVIDSTIAASIGAVPIEELKEGDTLVMGDLLLIKDIDKFITAPLAYNASTDTIIVTSGREVLKEQLTATLVKKLAFFPVDLHGRSETVATFVEENSVALGIPITHENFKYNKTIVANTRGDLLSPYLYTDGGTPSTVSTNADIYSVSYSVSFDSGLIAVPIDSSNKVYTLLFSAVALGKGAYNQVPYFKEDLSFHVRNDIMLDSVNINFSPLPNADYRRELFNEDYQELLALELRHNISLYLGVFCFIIMCMNWLVFCMFQLESFRVVCERVKYPNGNNVSLHGVDIPKILSFGIMTIDEEPSLFNVVKLFILEVVISVIIQVAIYVPLS
jgi:hypothetical protein